jgi:hypothetical protein
LILEAHGGAPDVTRFSKFFSDFYRAQAAGFAG